MSRIGGTISPVAVKNVHSNKSDVTGTQLGRIICYYPSSHW